MDHHCLRAWHSDDNILYMQWFKADRIPATSTPSTSFSISLWLVKIGSFSSELWTLILAITFWDWSCPPFYSWNTKTQRQRDEVAGPSHADRKWSQNSSPGFPDCKGLTQLLLAFLPSILWLIGAAGLSVLVLLGNGWVPGWCGGRKEARLHGRTNYSV